MTRRRKKRPIVPTTWIEWAPEFAELFRLVPSDWARPAKVRISAGRAHHTLTARFRSPAGHTVTSSLRLERQPEGGWSVTAETSRHNLGQVRPPA